MAGFSVCQEKVFVSMGNKEVQGQHWQHPHWHSSEKATSHLLRCSPSFPATLFLYQPEGNVADEAGDMRNV